MLYSQHKLCCTVANDLISANHKNTLCSLLHSLYCKKAGNMMLDFRIWHLSVSFIVTPATWGWGTCAFVEFLGTVKQKLALLHLKFHKIQIFKTWIFFFNFLVLQRWLKFFLSTCTEIAVFCVSSIIASSWSQLPYHLKLKQNTDYIRTF